MKDESDEILLERVNSRDKCAFKILFERYYYVLVSFASKFVKLETEAEDVVQDVFLELWSRNNNFDKVITLKSYMFTAVKNRCLLLLRHQKVKDKYISYQKNNVEDYVLNNVIEEEVYLGLKNEIAHLPLNIRKIYELVLEGKSNAEICKEINMSIDSVKSYKKRGKAMLLSRLKNKNIITLVYFFNKLLNNY